MLLIKKLIVRCQRIWNQKAKLTKIWAVSRWCWWSMKLNISLGWISSTLCAALSIKSSSVPGYQRTRSVILFGVKHVTCWDQSKRRSFLLVLHPQQSSSSPRRIRLHSHHSRYPPSSPHLTALICIGSMLYYVVRYVETYREALVAAQLRDVKSIVHYIHFDIKWKLWIPEVDHQQCWRITQRHGIMNSQSWFYATVQSCVRKL